MLTFEEVIIGLAIYTFIVVKATHYSIENKYDEKE